MKKNKMNLSMKKFGNISIDIEGKEYIFNLNTEKGKEDVQNFIHTINEIYQWYEMWKWTLDTMNDMMSNMKSKNFKYFSQKTEDGKTEYILHNNYPLFFEGLNPEEVEEKLKNDYESEYGKTHTLEFDTSSVDIYMRIYCRKKEEVQKFLSLFEKKYYKKVKKVVLSSKTG